MALHFHPRSGTVLLCDFDLGRSKGFPDEMTKQRPVVVLSSRLRRQRDPWIVVPLTTSPPAWHDQRQVRLVAGGYDFLRSDVDSWAKCEFVCAVSEQRLRRMQRHGAYIAPRLRDADLRASVRAAVCALGGVDLIAHT